MRNHKALERRFLLLIPMVCSFFGISSDVAMQSVTVFFIIGVVQDSVETALNSSGDVFLRLWQRSSIGRNTTNKAFKKRLQ